MLSFAERIIGSEHMATEHMATDQSGIPLTELERKVILHLAEKGPRSGYELSRTTREDDPPIISSSTWGGAEGIRRNLGLEGRCLIAPLRYLNGRTGEGESEAKPGRPKPEPYWLTDSGVGAALALGADPRRILAIVKENSIGGDHRELSRLQAELAIAVADGWVWARMRGSLADSILGSPEDLEFPVNPLEFIRLVYILKSHHEIARDMGRECERAAEKYSNLAQVFLDDDWNALHYSMLDLAKQEKGIPPADYLLEFLNAPQNRERGLKRGQALKFLQAVPGLREEQTEKSLNLLTAKGLVSEAEDGSVRLTPRGQREAGEPHPEFLSRNLKRQEQSVTGGAGS